MLSAAASGQEYKVVFDAPLTGGSFYTIQTTSQGKYDTYNGGRVFIKVPPGSDFSRTPNNLYTDLTHPVHAVQGVDNKLNTFGVPLTAREGSTNGQTLGTAKQFFNIGGTFRIVPIGDAPNSGSVKVFAQGLIDGQVGTVTKTLADAPRASLSASIMVEKIGTATASRGLDGSTTTTVGVEGTLAEDPSVKATASSSVQKLAQTGSGPKNFGAVSLMPINTPLVWNFTMNLEAMNTENFLGGTSAAWSWLTSQWVVLSPIKDTRVAQGDPSSTDSGRLQLHSSSTVAYSTGTGLTLRHPLVSNGLVTNEGIVNDDSTSGPTDTSDYTAFKTEAEFINDNNGFFTSDGLLASLLDYGSLTKAGTNPDGSVAFNDGILTFRTTNGTPLAHATIHNLLADPSGGDFGGQLTSFQYDTLAPGASSMADRLFAFGGTIALDPEIMSSTTNFLSSGATTAPFSTVIEAVPEPGMTLSIVVVAMAGMARRRVGRREPGGSC